MTRGLVLGKFYPPHKGHEYLVRFAAQYMMQYRSGVDVFVCTLDQEQLDGELRYQWMTELKIPMANIIWYNKDIPQEPKEHPDFWDIWRNMLTDNGARKYSHVFASEEYGHRLAQELDAEFVPVDINREMFPTSGTEVREGLTDPGCFEEFVSNWDNLIYPAQLDLTTEIRIVGPESTGKTTITNELARVFNSPKVLEYGRTYFEDLRFVRPDYECTPKDIEVIMKGHKASLGAVRAMNKVNPRPFIFWDTDAMATKLFSQAYFGNYPKKLDVLIDELWDMPTILLSPETDYVDDGMRDLPDQNIREWFFNEYREYLTSRRIPHIIVTGGIFESRTEQAWDAALKLHRANNLSKLRANWLGV